MLCLTSLCTAAEIHASVSDYRTDGTPAYRGGVKSTDNQTLTHANPEATIMSGKPAFAVGTNLLYDLLLVPNITVKAAFADRLTLDADWMCAWWSRKSRHRYYRIYGGDIDIAYRLSPSASPFAGHHLGLYASLVCYDFQFGRKNKGLLSDKYNYAVGISYAYSLPLAPRLNLDFSLGVGYMWGQFKKHSPIDDHDVWVSTHKNHWIGPTRLGVTLTWLLGSATNAKGGKR